MQGSPGSLGLTAPEMCFLPKTPYHLITCAACLCSPHIASAVIMPQTPCSSPTCLHKALLGPPQHAPSWWQEVSYKGAGRPRPTDKRGPTGRMHLPLTVQAPAGPQSAKKQRKAMG